MSTRIRHVLFAAVFLLFNYHAADAQTWQWGKRGGSSTTVGAGEDELVVDMATDPNGNLYVLSEVQTGMNIDGHPMTGYGYQDVVLTSFRCDGTYRWSKIMGGATNDQGVTVKTDSLGGVYIATYIYASSAAGGHIDADVTIPPTYKTNVLIKYDTAGVYQWHRYPQSDTVALASMANTFQIDMDVDNDGNCYCYYQLLPGAYGGGSYVVTTLSMHILKYNWMGFFMGGHALDMTFTMAGAQNLKMKRDHRNGNYIFTGNLQPSSGSLSFGSTPITHSMMVGYYNPSGSPIWVRQDIDDLGHSSAFGRAAVDADHNIYLGGKTSSTNVFNGYSVVNGGGHATPIVVKMDATGTNVWAKNATVNGATFCNHVALRNNEVVICGQYAGKLKWAGFTDSLNIPSGTTYNVYISRFNKNTGAVVKVDSLASSYGTREGTTAVASDKQGNVFVGGYFPGTITVAGTTLSSLGGNSDLYVAKYGYSGCNCITPTANYTWTGMATKNFTYTGTATYDSVRWDFGDGGTSTLASPVHTFASGTYTVCVTVYTSCGSDTYCQTMTIPPSTMSVEGAFKQMTIYPNPVEGQLFVGNVAVGTTITIYNIVGQKVHEVSAKGMHETVDMQGLPNGNYIVHLKDKDGANMQQMIVKQ